MPNHAFRVPVAAPGFVVSSDPINAAEPTAGTIAVDTIAEATAAAGVTVDGLRIKDSALTPVAGATALIDASNVGTGENDMIVKDNVADAFTIREATNAYLTVITTNSAEAVDVLKTLKVDTIAEHTADAGVTVDGTLIKDGGVTTADAGTITTNTIAEKTAASGVTVDGCLIKDGRAALLATAGMFASTEQTGTGGSQNVAHGLTTTPSLVWFTFTELGAALAGGADIAEGAHDGTNLVVTVTSGIKFKAYALK